MCLFFLYFAEISTIEFVRMLKNRNPAAPPKEGDGSDCFCGLARTSSMATAGECEPCALPSERVGDANAFLDPRPPDRGHGTSEGPSRVSRQRPVRPDENVICWSLYKVVAPTEV